ncbi:unnamed protein product [Euphydryas editha]|uniref:Uncharacterized protein n=2 Tax=Euphydryas editha TaxID=104508 RepID=A0AAU9UTH0_EUPED|nr:unnamed protein product [Euphydryas editha]
MLTQALNHWAPRKVVENFNDEEATLEEGFSIPKENTDAALPLPPLSPPAITPSSADALAEPGPSGLNQQERASRLTRPNRRRFSTQLENSRNNFATLAEREVSCMEMFAKSMEKMAETDRQRNENEREKNEILCTLVESQKERDQVMINLTGVLQEYNNSYSINESDPPSGFSDQLKEFGPNWPDSDSINENDSGLKTNSTHDVNFSNEYSEISDQDNIDIKTNLNISMNTSYNPLNTSDAIIIEKHAEMVINEELPPFRKSSLDIRKLEVPVASKLKRTTKKHLCPYSRDILITGRRVTGYIHENANDVLRNDVFPVLRDDKVSRSIRYDELLIKFGNKLTDKYTLKHQHDMIRAHLRLLGRLKLQVMSYDSQISEFQDTFNPQIYDTVIKSLRIVANWDITTMTFKTLAVASNLATLVTKCCKKFRTECIKIQDEQRKKLSENFLLLWQEEVPVLINKKALEDQFDKRQSKKIVLPSKEDVKRLYDYLNNECNICLEILKDEFNFNAWKLLTQCTLISIQIFNRRRAGEIERLLIANYQTKQDLTEHIDKELYKKLADTTKNFAKQFVRLTIRGKRGRPVPVLLNPLAVNCIDTILAYREQANVRSNNEFIFSVPGNNDTAKKYIRACPLMRRFSTDCGAAMPSTLRGTTLRKHVALTLHY